MSGKPSANLLSHVSRMEVAKLALAAFEAEHGPTVEQHERLRAEYNSAITETAALYKREYETIGNRFNEFSITERIGINAKKLVELLPGADMIVSMEYVVDRKEYNRLVKEGGIPSEVVRAVEFVDSIAVNGPKKA